MSSAPSQVIDLEIAGMTCTACAARVEKALNQIPGVSATVDFASERATLSIPGDSALLRKQLIEAVAQAGYEVAGRSPETVLLRLRLTIGALFAFPVALLGMFPSLHFAGWEFVALALTLPIVLWVAWPFHAATAKNLRFGSATMDTLITIGSLSAFGYSVWLILSGEHHNFLEVAAVVPVAVLLGKWLELKTRRSATDAVRALLAGLPEQVWTVDSSGQRRLVSLESVMPGDEVLVAAGERVPVDGKLLSEFASFDLAHLTGEAIPADIARGQEVAAGAVNRGGEVRIRATRLAAESRIARIAQLVREATAQKTKLRSLVDLISGVFVPVVILIAILSFLAWLLFAGDVELGVTAALSVLVVACPCALGIAIPMSLAVATGVGSKRGIVIRQPDLLSKLRKVKTVVFDKTGTLTSGELSVKGVEFESDASQSRILALAAALAAKSRHPVSKAIFSYCTSLSNLAELNPEGRMLEVAGRGLRFESKNQVLELLRPNPEDVERVRERLAVGIDSLPHISVFLVDGRVAAYFLVEDELRSESQTAINELKRLGISTTLLSGDIAPRVAALAAKLSIDKWVAEASPEDKLAAIRGMQTHSPVVMVGDGLNDTAVLAAAEVGIAMGSGSHAAQSAADITILDDNPERIGFAVRLGRATWANLTQNLGWAFGYNILLIPLAAFGLLEPMYAGIAMALSSVSVVLNSQRMGWRFRNG